MTDYREVPPPATPLEKQLKTLSLVILVVMVIYSITNFANLPDEIPIHFNAKGEADGWGTKNILFFIPGVCGFLFLMMHFIGNLKPKTYNFPVKLTEDNARKQVELAREMMQALNVVIFGLMFYILWRMVDLATGGTGGLGVFFMVVFLVAIFGVIGYYMRLAQKHA